MELDQSKLDPIYAKNETEDGFYTSEGWWIDSKDDIYDEIYKDKDPLAETYTYGSIVSPFKFVIGSVKYQPKTSTRNTDGTFNKNRPVLLLVQNGAHSGYFGFQVTSKSSKNNSYRTKFKYQLSNAAQYGLQIEPSYINYDHFVFLGDTFVTHNLNTSLSKEDCQALYDAINADYNELLSFQKTNSQRKHYTQLLALMKAYLASDSDDASTEDAEYLDDSGTYIDFPED